MLKSLGTEFKVGLFAIAALATLAYMFFVLSPEAFQNKKYNSYFTVLSNAAGIVSKTHVMTAGVAIGKVKSVALEGGQTRVVLEVDQAVKIPVGSKIEVRSVGLLGDKHLEIVRPEDTGQYVESGGIIPQSTNGHDMEALMDLVGDVAKDVKKVTATLANVMGTRKGQQQLENILDNIEALTSDIRATTGTLKKVVGNRENDINDIVTDVHSGMRDLKTVAANLKGIVNEENKERIDRILSSFDETMVDVKGSAKNINLISAKVEKGEGTIGKLVNDDATITELEGAIKDIRRVIAPVSKLQIDIDTHFEARSDHTSQSYFNMLFRTRPDRYYLIGLTNTIYENKVTTEQTTPQGTTGDTTSVKTVNTIRDDKPLRFNLQMAKRWYFVAARMGLFETTGGAAADFYLFEDRFRMSFEAFDFDTKSTTIRRNAHMKAYASVLFYNHLYAMGGLDDPSKTDITTNKARPLSDSVFFGAGLTFTDDDLKAIFGTAAVAASASK